MAPQPAALRAVERIVLHGVGRTDVGRARQQNEDAFYVDDFLGLYLVCDGMGGHASGQIASDLAVRAVVNALKTGEPPPAAGEEPLQCALQAANQAVFRRSGVDPTCRGMGTTAVAARVDGTRLHICHAGDSRAYLLRGDALSQLTRDHSLANLYQERPELAGQLGPATSNVIIRAIGLEPHVDIEHQAIELMAGDVVLLCCDGLTDLVADWMIREIMTSGDAPELVCENLIRAANGNGGSDNITAVLIAAHDGRASGFGKEHTRPGF